MAIGDARGQGVFWLISSVQGTPASAGGNGLFFLCILFLDREKKKERKKKTFPVIF